MIEITKVKSIHDPSAEDLFLLRPCNMKHAQLLWVYLAQFIVSGTHLVLLRMRRSNVLDNHFIIQIKPDACLMYYCIKQHVLSI